jgi:hypothetical protein
LPIFLHYAHRLLLLLPLAQVWRVLLLLLLVPVLVLVLVLALVLVLVPVLSYND